MRASIPLLILSCCVVGCNDTRVVVSGGDSGLDGDNDAGGDVAPVETGVDSSDDATDTGAPDPGPMTFVAAEMSFTDDRNCDIDGNGEMDNSIAALGPSSAVFLVAMNTVLHGSIEEDGFRQLFHLPSVEDRAGPNDPGTCTIFFKGDDSDVPPNPADDFLGGEPFTAGWRSIDVCGEPRFVSSSFIITNGVIEARSDGIPVWFQAEPFSLTHSRSTGFMEPGGTAIEMAICGAATFAELGASAGLPGSGDLSLLEGLLVGGAAIGMPIVPGLDPDLDLDGDGFESFVLDALGRIESCVDGDHSVIEGRDCWADARMADGFSLNIELEGVPALFAGRTSGWEETREPYHPGETCDNAPDVSLWDGC